MNLRLILLAAGNFAIGTSGFIIAGILPEIAKDLNVSISVAGQLVTIYAITYAIAAPLLVAFTGKIPRRTLLITALLILGVANLVSALTPNYEILFFARLVAALGGALYTPLSSAVAVSISAPEERGRALALVFSGLPIANVLGVPLGTLVGSNFGWRITFWIVAGMGFVAALALILILRNIPQTPPVNLKQWVGLLRQKTMLAALGITFWQYTAQLMVFTYIAPLLKQNTGIDGTGVSIMLFVFGFAAVIGNNLGGRFADRLNLNRSLAIILVGIVVCVILIPLASFNVLIAGILLVIWGLFAFSFNPVQQTRLITFAPQTPSLVLSLNSSMLYAGNAAGAGLGGIVVSAFSLPAIGWVGGGIALLALVSLFLSIKFNQAKKSRELLSNSL
jgi:MFS transporter, DHA1 family, inner membrane transport protein